MNRRLTSDKQLGPCDEVVRNTVHTYLVVKGRLAAGPGGRGWAVLQCRTSKGLQNVLSVQ